jgi:hypothetical protein
MSGLINHPWEFGLLMLVLLSCVMEFGCYLAGRMRLHAEPNRKEQMTWTRRRAD